MLDHKELLQTIEHNGRLSEAELSVMLGVSEKEVKEALDELKAQDVILGTSTVINWDKTAYESVTGMIEVRLMPQRDQGFDKIAERLYQYPQVISCYLMSGGFDLMLIIEDTSLHGVATFIATKVAPIDGVVSTSTHFILKTYKSDGIVFDGKRTDDRETIIL